MRKPINSYVSFSRTVALLVLLACPLLTPAQTSRLTPVVQATRKARTCVVAIYHPGKEPAAAAGVIVHEAGYVITNAHVVGRWKTLTVKLFDGTVLNGTVLFADIRCDLAVLRLHTDKKLKALVAVPIDDLEVGETVIVIGSPYGYINTVTTGIVSALNREITTPNGEILQGLIQVDAAVNPGNSGGPLLNINGEMIGVVVAVREGARSIAFAINADTIGIFCAKHVRPAKKSGIEPASGAVVQAFTTGTVRHVFLLAGSAPTEAWTGSAPGNKS